MHELLAGDGSEKIPHRGNVRDKCVAAVLLMLPRRRQGQGSLMLVPIDSKALCDFLFRGVFHLLRSISQIIAFDKECLLLMHSFLVTCRRTSPHPYHRPNGTFFGWLFVASAWNLSATSLTYFAFKCDAFS